MDKVRRGRARVGRHTSPSSLVTTALPFITGVVFCSPALVTDRPSNEQIKSGFARKRIRGFKAVCARCRASLAAHGDYQSRFWS